MGLQHTPLGWLFVLVLRTDDWSTVCIFRDVGLEHDEIAYSCGAAGWSVGGISWALAYVVSSSQCRSMNTGQMCYVFAMDSALVDVGWQTTMLYKLLTLVYRQLWRLLYMMCAWKAHILVTSHPRLVLETFTHLHEATEQNSTWQNSTSMFPWSRVISRVDEKFDLRTLSPNLIVLTVVLEWKDIDFEIPLTINWWRLFFSLPRPPLFAASSNSGRSDLSVLMLWPFIASSCITEWSVFQMECGNAVAGFGKTGSQ